MARKTLAEGLFAIVSVPVCAGLALGAYMVANWLFALACPQASTYRVLVSGLFAMWGVVLFGLLFEESNRIAGGLSQPAVARRRVGELRAE